MLIQDYILENHTAALTDSHKVDALWERRLSGKTLKEKRCVRRNGKKLLV